jgi:hypothetical protein
MHTHSEGARAHRGAARGGRALLGPRSGRASGDPRRAWRRCAARTCLQRQRGGAGRPAREGGVALWIRVGWVRLFVGWARPPRRVGWRRAGGSGRRAPARDRNSGAARQGRSLAPAPAGPARTTAGCAGARGARGSGGRAGRCGQRGRGGRRGAARGETKCCCWRRRAPAAGSAQKEAAGCAAWGKGEGAFTAWSGGARGARQAPGPRRRQGGGVGRSGWRGRSGSAAAARAAVRVRTAVKTAQVPRWPRGRAARARAAGAGAARHAGAAAGVSWGGKGMASFPARTRPAKDAAGGPRAGRGGRRGGRPRAGPAASPPP